MKLSQIKEKPQQSNNCSPMFLLPFCFEFTAVTSSPDPTPERDAVLKAGLSALLRANSTPVQTQQNPVSLQVVKPIKPVKQAVLLPAQLKVCL